MASLFYACGDFKNCEKHYVIYVQTIEIAFGKDVIHLYLIVKTKKLLVFGKQQLLFFGWSFLLIA